MSFEDLPDHWHELPLCDDKTIDDVLDLFVSMRSRYDGGLFVLILDRDRRIVVPILVEEIEISPPPDSDVMLDNLVTAIVSLLCEVTAVVAIARPGRRRVYPFDEEWAGYVERACAGRLPLLGIHLVTPGGILPVRRYPLAA